MKSSSTIKKVFASALLIFILVGATVPSQVRGDSSNNSLLLQVNDPVPTTAVGVDAEAVKINSLLDAATSAAADNVSKAQYRVDNPGCLICASTVAGNKEALQIAKDAQNKVDYNVTIAKSYLNDAKVAIKKGDINAVSYAIKNARDRTNKAISYSSQNLVVTTQDISKAAAVTDGPSTCTIDLNFSLERCIRLGISFIAYIIITIVSFLLWLGGLALDWAIANTVVDISSNITSIHSIDTFWRLFRDIANLSFIFILLYVAIMTILQSNGTAAARTLKQIVLAAIFINFSLFIAKVVIDTSNIVTLAFYHQLVPNIGDTLSGKFMQALGLPKIFGPGTTDMVTSWAKNWSTLFSTTIGIGMAIFVTAFSFLAAAWLFIIRFVVIIIILIVSPIAFVGTLLPKTSEYSTRWWKALIGQALFPPLYMLFVWIAVSIGSATNKDSFLSRSGDVKQVFSPTADTAIQNGASLVSFSTGGMNVLIRYIIMIILLNVALTVAKTQADKSGKRVSGWTDWGVKKVEGVRKVTQGYMGRGAVRATGLNRLDENFKKTSFANTRLGSYIQKNTTGLATSAKFSSKNSIIDVDKDAKKLKDDYAKEQDKEADKKADKLGDNKEYIRTFRMENIDKRLRDEQGKIALYDAARRNTSTTPDEQRVAQEKYNEANAKARVYNNQKTSLAALPIEKIDATQEERKSILKKVRTEMADKLYSLEDQKKDEERKKEDEARSPLRKVAGAIFNPIRLYRRLTANEDTRGRNVEKAAAKSLRDKAKGKGDSLTELLKKANKEAGVEDDTKSKPAAPPTP